MKSEMERLNRFLGQEIANLEFDRIARQKNIDMTKKPAGMDELVWNGKHLVGYFEKRSWRDTKGNLYHFSKKKVFFNGRVRYVGLFYRYYKTKKMWLCRKVIASAKKRIVKERLRQLYNKL